jgi:hypothetical protein
MGEDEVMTDGPWEVATLPDGLRRELRLLGQENLPDVIGTVESWVRGDEAVWPYARCIENWGPEFEMYRIRWARGGADMVGPERTGAMMAMRRHYVERIGMMLPCAELLDELAKAALVVEIGAGSGFMTAIMRHRQRSGARLSPRRRRPRQL